MRNQFAPPLPVSFLQQNSYLTIDLSIDLSSPNVQAAFADRKNHINSVPYWSYYWFDRVNCSEQKEGGVLLSMTGLGIISLFIQPMRRLALDKLNNLVSISGSLHIPHPYRSIQKKIFRVCLTQILPWGGGRDLKTQNFWCMYFIQNNTKLTLTLC